MNISISTDELPKLLRIFAKSNIRLDTQRRENLKLVKQNEALTKKLSLLELEAEQMLESYQDGCKKRQELAVLWMAAGLHERPDNIEYDFHTLVGRIEHLASLETQS